MASTASSTGTANSRPFSARIMVTRSPGQPLVPTGKWVPIDLQWRRRASRSHHRTGRVRCGTSRDLGHAQRRRRPAMSGKVCEETSGSARKVRAPSNLGVPWFQGVARGGGSQSAAVSHTALYGEFRSLTGEDFLRARTFSG
jgi:hypothetical protein